MRLFIIAGESSGDHLGGPLIAALRRRAGGALDVHGVGGEAMIAQGLTPLFPIDDITVMGMDAVLARLPTLLRRIKLSADAVVAAKPDALIIIDAPDFTHRVARRVRRQDPSIPIVDYVSPSVWAWRPGRAKAMRAYVDRLLAILPFEPQVHAKLGGPPCLYVGHPLVSARDPAALRPRPAPRAADPVHLLVLPGSRRGEIDRLLEPFGAALARITAARPGLRATLPAVSHLADTIEERVRSWPVKPDIVRGDAAKWAAFRDADAALAASGTVTLELALAGIPMVVAYKLDRFYRLLKQFHRLVPIASVDTMVLANIIGGDKAIPEFLDDQASPEALARSVLNVLRDGPARDRQLALFATIDRQMTLPDGLAPSEAAAEAVMATIGAQRPSA